jgi:hypothetical protein
VALQLDRRALGPFWLVLIGVTIGIFLGLLQRQEQNPERLPGRSAPAPRTR